MQIQESDMVFGEFVESDCYYIDKEGGYYKTKLSGYGIKSVDFILHRENRNKLLFVEARKSIAGADSLHRCLDSEIADVSQKFMDSLQLVLGIWIGSHKKKNAKPPSNFDNFIGIGKSIVFVLVIKNMPSSPTYIEDEIHQHLRKESKIWRFDVKVFDESFAEEEGLVVKGGAAL